MGEQLPKPKVGLGERGARVYRNLNIVAAAALFGAGVVVPPIAPAMNVLAAIDLAQAGAAEVVVRSGKTPH